MTQAKLFECGKESVDDCTTAEGSDNEENGTEDEPVSESPQRLYCLGGIEATLSKSEWP